MVVVFSCCVRAPSGSVEGRDTAAGSARITRRVSGCCGVVLLSGEPVAACERLVVDSVAGVVSIVTVVVAPAPPGVVRDIDRDRGS